MLVMFFHRIRGISMMDRLLTPAAWMTFHTVCPRCQHSYNVEIARRTGLSLAPVRRRRLLSNRQPHPSMSHLLISAAVTSSSSVDLSLSSSKTPSPFTTGLKNNMFHKSFPVSTLYSSTQSRPGGSQKFILSEYIFYCTILQSLY